MRYSSWLGVAALIVFVSGSRADVYRWTDEKGTTHFTDDITSVPTKFRGKVKKVALPPPPARSGESLGHEDTRASGGGDETDDLGHTADYWRAKVLEAKEALRASEAEKAEIEGRLMRLNPLTAPPGEIARLKGTLDGLQTTIKELKRNLEVDIPEEARRAGAPPGWLRVD